MTKDLVESSSVDARIDWAKSADVVVVGGGTAGWAAAVAAANRGASVIVLESADHIGGTTLKATAGAFWIPNNSKMREAGLEDPREEALDYMCRLAYPQLYDPQSATRGVPRDIFELIEFYVDNAAGVVDTLEELGAIDAVAAVDDPDYHPSLPENKAPFGRQMRPVGTNMAARDGGALLIRGLKAKADELGVQLLMEHRVRHAISNAAGEIVGVVAQTPAGDVHVRAHRAVVFGTGGFAHDSGLLLDYLSGPVYGAGATPHALGDFVRIGIEVGAALGNMSHGWYTQVPLEAVVRDREVDNGIWVPFGASMIQVNKYGHRVVNEKMVYNERTQVHFHWRADTLEYPNLALFMVYDDSVAENDLDWFSRNPIPLPGESTHDVVSGQTLKELASNLEERLQKYSAELGGLKLASNFADELKATIERYNSMAESGEDLDFHRGETVLQTAWHGPASPEAANPTMSTISSEGPYHAIILVAGLLDTKGGPKANAKGQILDPSAHPIPGLYGAGNCIASPAGQAYWAGGATLGLALVYGYVAGLEAASEPKHQIDAAGTADPKPLH
ncbi:FAD-dependent oxidoreductase [Rhodococcus koreensis]